MCVRRVNKLHLKAVLSDFHVTLLESRVGKLYILSVYNRVLLGRNTKYLTKREINVLFGDVRIS